MKNNPPEIFKSGIHVLMLIDRGVQNSNKGSKRWINKIISTNPAEWDDAASRLVELQWHLNEPDIRLYASINPRSSEKAIRHFKHRQLDLNSDDMVNFYRRINDSFCSSLMQPECRDGSLFLLDVDSKDLTEVNAFLVSNHELKVEYCYPTPNGWHYIMEPFNPKLAEGLTSFEIKKDTLMLINWIDIYEIRL